METIKNIEELYEKYKPPIYTYLYYQTGNREAAEELCQEVFLRAFKSLTSYRGDCSVKTWLYTIARNLHATWYKREVKYEMLTLDNIGEAEFISDKASPEETVEKREKREQVRNILNLLKEEYRSVLILCDIMEFSYGEIASLMGWNLSKVKITIYRARIQFKTLFESEGDNR
ncbi:RNA polymerase sigma factor [Clostridium swellfunianum]|uniref:RNA polymerase sigma factor n=1 Tax=Clostridium swellfunianum TaxID=1367462 RepID=UPI00202E5A96|nr:RNA polymerase sigma factor [Clostridium swellfunianum]MCM0649159.1 RNA polymerase sigma factor [Clostridium swellfunianum]